VFRPYSLQIGNLSSYNLYEICFSFFNLILLTIRTFLTLFYFFFLFVSLSLNFWINKSESFKRFHGSYDPSFFVTVIMGMTSYECSLYRSSKWRNMHDTSGGRTNKQLKFKSVFSGSSNWHDNFLWKFWYLIMSFLVIHSFLYFIDNTKNLYFLLKQCTFYFGLLCFMVQLHDTPTRIYSLTSVLSSGAAGTR
jgi:hypothetical protein